MISIVVPVYWNEGSLPLLKAEFEEIADEFPSEDFEFIFVDDGSGDKSFMVLEELASQDERVKLVQLSRNFGSNIAILAGLSHAQGDAVAVISADLQDPPQLIPQMIREWQQGTEVVLAARATRDDPWLSRLFASTFNRLYRRFVFPDFPPNGFDFMLIDRQVVEIIVQLQEKNSYIFGQVMWVGFNRTVLEYDRTEREHGQSMWTFTKKIKYFIDAFSAFSYLPLRLASFAGGMMAIIGFIYAFIVLFLRVTTGFDVEGWASMIIVLLIVSGTQLILMGVMGEYLWRVLDESRKRPTFIVRRRVNLDKTS